VYPRHLHVGLRIAALAIMDGRTKSDLRWAASHDPLTLLINRAEFSRRLEAMDDSVALLYIDLDDFKPVNDVFGHSIGDAVLVEVAARIRATIGPDNLAGRLGGDEFAVAIPGAGDIAVGLALAHRLVDVLRRPIHVNDLTVGIGASVGVASGIQPLIPSVLIHRADEALLEAKHAGRNMVKSAALG
jgi:diguanylate cyclase (GGDEF)-like protein